MNRKTTRLPGARGASFLHRVAQYIQSRLSRKSGMRSAAYAGLSAVANYSFGNDFLRESRVDKSGLYHAPAGMPGQIRAGAD